MRLEIGSEWDRNQSGVGSDSIGEKKKKRRKDKSRQKREERREKREERREKRQERYQHDQDERVEGRNLALSLKKRETSTIRMRGSKDAMVRPQAGGMAQKRVGP